MSDDELDRFTTAFAGTNADAVIHRQHENFAVSDLSLLTRSSTFENRVDCRLNKRFVYGDLQLNFAEQINAELVTAINAGLTLLTTEALAIHHCQSKDFDLGQSLFNGFQFTGLDDGDDQLHGNNRRPKSDPSERRGKSEPSMVMKR
jgi:hypothetical protein